MYMYETVSNCMFDISTYLSVCVHAYIHMYLCIVYIMQKHLRCKKGAAK